MDAIQKQIKQTLCADCKGVAESLHWVCWQTCDDYKQAKEAIERNDRPWNPEEYKL